MGCLRYNFCHCPDNVTKRIGATDAEIEWARSGNTSKQPVPRYCLGSDDLSNFIRIESTRCE
ncbi:hypothetical protein [Coleofasciculus sp. F4-SAH-05]|uniref:hypothetical protein n=1 Tax=Coleofasciculus sp. F4-SAH-05 TaxID=3069525 RepID=UPI0032FD747D